MKTRLFSSIVALAVLLSFITLPAFALPAYSATSLSPPQTTEALATVATSSCGSGWYLGTFSTAWEAKIRHGGTGYRAILNTVQFSTGGTVPWPNASTMHLTLAYNSSTGYATMTVNGALPAYDPVVMTAQVPGTNGKLLLTGKTSSEAVGTVVVSNVSLNGDPISPCTGFNAQGTDGTRDIKYLIVDGVSGDFTLACDVLFTWSSASDEGPALQIDVENLPPPTPAPTPTPPPDTSTTSTPTGSNVTVYSDTSVITFSTVTISGTTSVTTNAPNTCGGLPENLKPEKVITFIDINTTADYGGPITVGVRYDPEIVKNPKSLKLFHCKGTEWEDVTTNVDTTNNIVYGQVSSFSLFLLAGGGCFIATAAYGSPLDSHVDTLRSFRDNYLETNPLGSAFVSLYYKVSPPMADYIEKHPTLKPIVRVALIPAVAMSSIALSTTPLQKLLIMLALLASLSTVTALLIRRRVRRQRIH